MLAHHVSGSDCTRNTTDFLPPAQSSRTQFIRAVLFTSSMHYRLQVLSRFAAAVLGGYLLSASITALLPLVLPLKRTDAVLLTLSLSVLFYAVSFIAAFYFRGLKYIWCSLIGCSLLFAGLSVLLQGKL